MRLHESRVRRLLRECDFTSLFVEELGWNHCTLSPITVPVDGREYTLTAISEMGGLLALQCGSASDASIPDYHVRRKIDRLVSKLHYEHIIIYCDEKQQVWQWVKKAPGQPSASREHHFYYDQSGLPLIQKLDGLVFALDELDKETGNVSIKAVSDRVKSALDVDKVTKKFYDRFKEELKAFKGFITGITNEAKIDWYASLMLNRLMFIYFIQKKGFLDRNTNYLRDRLRMVQEQRGENHFYSFYRSFLRVLFREGLNSSKEPKPEILGNVPYLNGGLFEEHEIEQESPDLDIPDDAFERVFGFFEQYEWHLDTRPLRNDKEINPDVLGYIFEKYVNQKQMGAYYTKEDITEYISKNTVIPYLFDAARKKCAIAFDGENSVWDLLSENPDAYICPAVKLGIVDPDGNVIPESELPDFVQVGMHDPKARMFDKRYNLTEADLRDENGNKLTLPTETWREYVERRNRCLEVRSKLAAGEVRSIDDLITLNLDIRQFAQDVIENTESPDLLRSFWEVLRKITVLDPTCGSGAFLFAALNILEPLYEGCLGRMREFLEVWGDVGKKAHPNYHKRFTETLQRVEEHPNARYFIFKSIILNNLYGVDIMPEAVEICKLRLFLKLAAEVEPDQAKPNMGLEPLPDIDFNIRAGNTLVGFATYEEVRRAVTSRLDFEDAMASIEEKAAEIGELFELFRDIQEMPRADITSADKQHLRDMLKPLEDELNKYLAEHYGDSARDYDQWLQTHQPFHWFVEFHGIMRNGGFDVIIGNPPYKDLSITLGYRVKELTTAVTNNLYPLVLERAFGLGSDLGRQGFIVPVSSVSTEGYSTLQALLLERDLHFSSFDDRPSRLFDGLEHVRLTIHLLGQYNDNPSLFSTRYRKWFSLERPWLFSSLVYSSTRGVLIKDSMPKLYSRVERSILTKMITGNKPLSVFCVRHGEYKTYYSRKVGYFLQALDFQPEVRNSRGELRPPSEFKQLRFGSTCEAKCALSALNSNLFYWFVTVFSDCRHLNKREVDAFPFDIKRLDSATSLRLSQSADALMRDLDAHSEHRRMSLAHDTLTVQCIIPKHSKLLIDEVDRVLAQHYDFTEDELDFIINYDIKYRMGLGGDNGEEGE